MNNLKCQLPNHHEKKIITVCLDSDCQNKRLSCYLCIAQIHNSHSDKIIEVEQINDFIEQESAKQEKDPLTYSHGQSQIIKGLEKLYQLIEDLLKVIKEQLDQIKRQNLQEFLKQSANIQQGVDQRNSLIENLLKYIQVENCQLIQRQEKESKLSDMEKRSIETIKNSELSLQQILKSFSHPQPNDLGIVKDFSFSNEYKHKNIKIEEKFIAEYTEVVVSYSLIYTNLSFDPRCQSIEFDIEILQKACNIWVGVGQAQNAKNVDYVMSTWPQLGHGQYMMIHQGNPLHSTNESVNGKTSSFGFGTGDVIRIQYEVDTNILKFTNLQKKLEYQMKIIELEEKLYPAVLLYRQGDTVRISNGRIF